MNIQYQNQYNQLAREMERLDPDANGLLQSLFTFFSANLLHFLPTLSVDDHQRLFKACCLYQKLNKLDQQFFGQDFPLQIRGWDAEWVGQVRRTPGIICTMHAGSYRLINYLLAIEGVPHALLTASAFKREQEQTLRQLYPRLGVHPEAVPIIDAERSSAPRNIVRLIKQGYSVVVYVDGDTGSTLADPSKLVQVPFLGQHILARRGVARMAHWANAPIYPIFNFREGKDVISLFRGKTLFPQGHSAKAFEGIAIPYIYGHFASLLMHYPMQWENWFRLHLNIDHSARIRPADTSSAVGLFESSGDYFLLEKRDYRVIPMAAFQ